MADQGWYADVPISLPRPAQGRPILGMGGFIFTDNGIEHDIDAVDFERAYMSEELPGSPDGDDGSGDLGAEFL